MNEVWLKGSRWERAARRSEEEPAPAEPVDLLGTLRHARKILLLPNDRVGGLLLSGRLYKALRGGYPQAQIHLLTDSFNVSLAQQIPGIDAAFVGHWHKPLRSAEYRETQRRLRDEAYDLALCLGADCSYRLARLCGESGAAVRMGYRREGMAPFNFELVPANRGGYEPHGFGFALALLGCTDCGPLEWKVSPERVRQVRERYFEPARGGDAGGSYYPVAVDLHEGEDGGLGSRQWEELIGRIIERGGKVTLFHGPAERKILHALKHNFSKHVQPYDREHLAEAGAILQCVKTLVSCNTDLLHLAMALRAPAVALYSQDPVRWLAADNALVQRVEVADWRRLRVEPVMAAFEKSLKIAAAV